MSDSDLVDMVMGKLDGQQVSRVVVTSKSFHRVCLYFIIGFYDRKDEGCWEYYVGSEIKSYIPD